MGKNFETKEVCSAERLSEGMRKSQEENVVCGVGATQTGFGAGLQVHRGKKGVGGTWEASDGLTARLAAQEAPHAYINQESDKNWRPCRIRRCAST